MWSNRGRNVVLKSMMRSSLSSSSSSSSSSFFPRRPSRSAIIGGTATRTTTDRTPKYLSSLTSSTPSSSRFYHLQSAAESSTSRRQPSSVMTIRHWSSTLPNLNDAETKKKNDDNDMDKPEKNDTTTTTTTTTEERGNDKEDTKRKEGETLEETVRRMQKEDGASSDDGKSSSFDPQLEGFMRTAMQGWSKFRDELGETWEELLKTGERKDINKKIHVHHPEDTPEGDKEYTGPVSIMVIDESENLTAWERMQKRLTEAPIISDILTRTEEVYEKSGAKKVKQKADHLAEDAREAWETSQNPWVYRISSVYETLTAETPESIAVAELRKLDPSFTLEDWRQDVVEHTLPKIMEWLLLGKINQLKPWLGEGVFKRIAAEITARKQEGVQIDTHVLGIMNSEILAVEPDEVEKGSPIIVLHFMCQQINCVRKKKDGTIVEGSEDDIRANSYVAAFQREYDEKAGELNWKIVDFRFNGAIAYL